MISAGNSVPSPAAPPTRFAGRAAARPRPPESAPPRRVGGAIRSGMIRSAITRPVACARDTEGPLRARVPVGHQAVLVHRDHSTVRLVENQLGQGPGHPGIIGVVGGGGEIASRRALLGLDCGSPGERVAGIVSVHGSQQRGPVDQRKRRRPESNRCRRLCRPLRSHSATSPRCRRRSDQRRDG